MYFAGGEGEDLVRNNHLGWVLSVNDMNALQNFIDSISLEKLDTYPKMQVQKNAVVNFNFSEQFLRLVSELNKI